MPVLFTLDKVYYTAEGEMGAIQLHPGSLDAGEYVSERRKLGVRR